MPSPKFILGDFNARSTIWGNEITNKRGREIEYFLERVDLVLLNDQSPTFFSTHNTFTSIDLTFASPAIAHRFEWSTVPDPHGSDHFPIIIKTSGPSKCKFTPSFVESSGDWAKFSRLISTFLRECPSSTYTNKETARAASCSIPVTKPKHKHQPPWFSPNIANLCKEKKQSLK